jgi:FkbM family methyltransferase
MAGTPTSWAEHLLRRAAAAAARPFHTKQRELAEHLRRIFAVHGVDCVIDVGAHRGKYRRFLRYEVGFAGEVVSVEPIPELAAALAERARTDPRWQVHPCALGASAGTASLNVMASTDFSSFLAPDHSGTAQYAAANAIARVEKVEVRTLDGLASGLKPAPRNVYLKLDTQGYDLQVLRGAAQTLARVVALQSELSFVPIYSGMPSWRESIECIMALGYRLSGMFAVSRDASQGLIEADCVFVRAP